MNEPQSFDFAVIGAGIAGASVAAELAPHGAVVMLEMESQPGYHTTGRSAALFAETYGPGPIRALTRASAPFFDQPPAAFGDGPLLTPRGILMIAREDQLESLDGLMAELSADSRVTKINAEKTRNLVPLLREDYIAAAMQSDDARDIDVNGLQQGYLRVFREAGGRMETNCPVRSLERHGNGWIIETRTGTFYADIIINAAGAWADELGTLAKANKIGLVPKRRTVVTTAPPDGYTPRNWPMIVDVDEQFFLKADAGQLLISPADETPSPPCDAQPEEIDVAVCVDRIETACDLQIRKIGNKWAGLRSFVADKCPVCGFDDQIDGFFWLAGQGGYGIQSAPALSRVAASLVRGVDVPPDIVGQGLELSDLSVTRLST